MSKLNVTLFRLKQSMLKCLMTELHIFISQASLKGRTTNFLVALDEMEAEDMKGLVVDVRQNPGGRLDTAIDISDLFVENGKNIFQLKEKDTTLKYLLLLEKGKSKYR